MVYIEKRKIGNNVYLYLCKKERVNGKVKRTLNLYLGKEENLRVTKNYVPIDIDLLGEELGVDGDIIFGRLYYVRIPVIPDTDSC